ncbi:hypothetical protein FOZ62_015435, partial [Perkinsus olseni]
PTADILESLTTRELQDAASVFHLPSPDEDKSTEELRKDLIASLAAALSGWEIFGVRIRKDTVLGSRTYVSFAPQHRPRCFPHSPLEAILFPVGSLHQQQSIVFED